MTTSRTPDRRARGRPAADSGALTTEWMLIIAFTVTLALLVGPRIVRAVTRQGDCVARAVTTGTQQPCVRR